LYLWGYNEAGNLGLNHTNEVPTPSRSNFFKIQSHKMMDVSLGEDHCVFLSEEGMVFTAGKTSCGRLGVSRADCVDEGVVKATVIGDENDFDEGVDEVDEGEERDDNNNNGSEAEVNHCKVVESSNVVMENVGERFVDSISNAFVNDAPLFASPICIGVLFDNDDNDEDEGYSYSNAGTRVGLSSGGAHNVAFRCGKNRNEGSGKVSFLVNCKNTCHGCRGKLLNSLIETHESVCRFATKSCSFVKFGCKEKVLFLNEIEHHEQNCEYRLVPCDKCGEHVSTNSLKENGAHAEICVQATIECGVCGDLVERRDFEEHQKTHEEVEEEVEEEEEVKVEEVEPEPEPEPEPEEPKPAKKESKPKPVMRRQSTAKRTGGGFSLK